MTIDPNATIDEVAVMVMDIAFRFKIGDVVAFASVPKAPAKGFYNAQTQFFGTVHGRFLQQCHGGIQRQYAVRFHALTGGHELLNEDELRPLNEVEKGIIDGEPEDQPTSLGQPTSRRAKLKDQTSEGEATPKDGVPSTNG